MLSTLRYTCDADGTPVPCPDVNEWYRWMESRDHHVCHDEQVGVGWRVVVSTIFIGIDLGAGLSPEPILWETLIFTEGILSELDLEGRRHTSRDAAILAHQETCMVVAEKLAAVTLSSRAADDPPVA